MPPTDGDSPTPDDASRLDQTQARLTETGTETRGPVAAGPGDEVVEHIPWERLTLDGRERPAWLPYALGTVLAGVAAVAIFTFRATPSEPTVITLPPDSKRTETAQQPDPEAADPGDAPPASTQPVAAPGQIVAEADLMAFVPALAETAAAVRAEWFVLDYFSSSDALRAEKLAAALAAGVEVAVPDPGSTSYVDWVRAFATEPGPDGTYVVTVLYRALVATGDGPYTTGPVRAVTVPVSVGPDGSSAVLDLPAPARLPSVATGTPVVGWQTAEPPETLLERVRADLGDGGQAVRLLHSETDGARWRIVVEWGDETGGWWPHAVVVDGTGEPVAPGAAQSEK